MKKLFVFLILVLLKHSIFGQEKRTPISGKILIKNIPIVDVHILNLQTQNGTITNDKGLFELTVQLGDSLLYSHLNLKSKTIVVTKKIITEKNLIIHLDEKTIVLQEFTLKKQQSIFYKDPEITKYNGPKVNAKTLNLPFANTTVQKDKAIIKFRSGGIISLDNLINSINGKNKREKFYKKMVSEDTQLEKIRKQLTDDFFITHLKIKKEYINPFLNDCVDKNIIGIFKNDSKIKLLQLLIEESKFYPHKIIYEHKPLTKQ